MFDLAYDAKHSVLLSRFSGTYSPADIALRDNAVRRFVSKNGLVRGLMDYTAVDSIALDAALAEHKDLGALADPANVRPR